VIVPHQSTHYYAPGQDRPSHHPTFADDVANALLEHFGERVHLEAVVGGDPWSIRETVLYLRRLGWTIEAQRGVPGHTLTGWSRPEGWLRPDALYREYRRIILRGQRRRRKVMPNQLRLVKGGAGG